jgi:hypothetical protein
MGLGEDMGETKAGPIKPTGSSEETQRDHDKCLRDALNEIEQEVKEADNLKKAKKAAAAIEAEI